MTRKKKGDSTTKPDTTIMFRQAYVYIAPKLDSKETRCVDQKKEENLTLGSALDRYKQRDLLYGIHLNRVPRIQFLSSRVALSEIFTARSSFLFLFGKIYETRVPLPPHPLENKRIAFSCSVGLAADATYVNNVREAETFFFSDAI